MVWDSSGIPPHASHRVKMVVPLDEEIYHSLESVA
jgi:hypothetical protein